MMQHRGDESAQWGDWAQRFPIGTNVEGEVLEVWQVGAHIRLDGGPEALLLNGEMTWDGLVADARAILHKGQRVKVQVLSVESWGQRIYVSLRRAAHDPWKEHAASYRKGKTARALVAQFTRDAVLVEFEDHVAGFIPRPEIAEGVARPEEILETGDWVEVKVVEKDDLNREVKASMKLRLAEIEEEIQGELETTPAEPAENPHEAEAAPSETPETTVDVDSGGGERMPRILVVEDDPLQRLQLRAILEDLGYRHVREAGEGPAAIEAARQHGYDLIFMDQEMPAGNGDAGIRAAEEIKREFPQTTIVLVTGNKPAWEPPEEAPSFLSGMISKPFDLERIRAAMKQLRDTKSVGWPEVPGVLTEQVPHGVEFIERISRISHAARPLRDVLAGILSELKSSTGARGTAIFGWNRSNEGSDARGGGGGAASGLRAVPGEPPQSPVADLVYQPDMPMFYRNIDEQAAGKFLYLRGILGPVNANGQWPLRSCIGEYVGEEFDSVYTLFAFGDRVEQFRPEARILTRAAATVARAAIREHWIVAQVVSERRLTMLGGIVTSAAHELRGRLSALEAVSSVERSWRQLRSHAEKLKDGEFLADTEERIAGLKRAKQAMDNVVGRILDGCARPRIRW